MPRGQRNQQGVGSSQGQAFTYDRSNLTPADPNGPATNYLNLMAKQAEAARAINPQIGKDNEAFTAAMKTLSETDPWYKYDREIQEEVDVFYEQSANMRAAGVANPLTHPSEAGVAMKQQYDKILRYSGYTKQIKERYGELTNEVAELAKKGMKVTPETARGIAEWVDAIPLSDHISTGAPAPAIVIEEAEVHELDFMKGVLKGIDKNTFTEEDVRGLVDITLRDKTGGMLINSRVTAMSEEQRKAATELAADAGMKLPQYLAQQTLMPLLNLKEGEEYDVLGSIDAIFPGVSKSVREDGDVTTSWSGIPTSKINAGMKLWSSNPNNVRAGVEQNLFGSRSATEEENKKAAAEYYREYVKTRSNSSSGRSEDEPREGADRDVKTQISAGQWEEDLKSTDPARVAKAAGWMEGASLDDGDGYTSKVISTRVVPVRKLGMYMPEAGTEVSDDQYAVELELMRTTELPDGTIKTIYTQYPIYPGMDKEELRLYHDNGRNAKGKDNDTYYGDQGRGFNEVASPGATGRGLPAAPGSAAPPSPAKPALLKGLTGRK